MIGETVWREGQLVLVQAPRHKRLGGRVWQRITRRVVNRDGGVCFWCGLDGADSADHLIPLADGGSNELHNLRASHLRCNLSRNARRSTAIRAAKRRARRHPRIY